MRGPLVIRLNYVVRAPFRRRTALSRRAVFARDGYKCQYCGKPADSIDHVMPRSRGGEHTWENVAAACRRCNLHKRDRTPNEAGMILAKTPHTPRDMAWITTAVGRVPEAWKQYLLIAS
ncbi:MAG: HNH endonuclease [Actinobacteria bacterium]|nr:HNH endonuclease [Actinomycetota bacterium]